MEDFPQPPSPQMVIDILFASSAISLRLSQVLIYYFRIVLGETSRNGRHEEAGGRCDWAKQINLVFGVDGRFHNATNAQAALECLYYRRTRGCLSGESCSCRCAVRFRIRRFLGSYSFLWSLSRSSPFPYVFPNSSAGC